MEEQVGADCGCGQSADVGIFVWNGVNVKKMGGPDLETAPELLTKHWQALTTNSNNSSFKMTSAGLSAFSAMVFAAIE
jgi:hypothetical protein